MIGWRKSVAALAIGVAVFGVAACDSDNDVDPDQVNDPSTEIDPDQINDPDTDVDPDQSNEP